MNLRLKGICLLLILCFIGTTQGVAQSETLETQNLTAAFEAYKCDFDSETNQVVVSTALVGANGLPIPVTDIALTVSPISEQGELISDDVNVATIAQRPPLQMIVVLDTTETVPVEEIIAEMVTDLFPRLPVEDEVALITFSQEIQPRTAFYTDKNRLINEHVLDLQTLEGDNRLYAAMLQAITSFQLESDARQVVLVLSDSGRRESDTTEVEEIITRAQLNNVQFFPMGFYTNDFPRPSREDFFAIANGTGGFAWFYDQPYISRTDVAETIGEYLTEFVDTLNSEVSINIDMQSIDTGSAEFIDFLLTADTANDQVLQTQVTCPIERLNHSITFVSGMEDAVVRGTFDVGVVSNSDFPPEDTVVRFKANDQILQDTGESIFTFDSQNFAPGYYTITAELLDRRGNILATTPSSIRLFAQQTLGLSIIGDQNNLSGAVQLVLTSTSPEADFTEAEFTVATVTNPTVKEVLGRAVFDSNNVATLQINDINTAVANLFPSAPLGTQFVFGGRVLGLTRNDPLFAVADDVSIIVGQAPMATPVPVQVVTPQAPPEPINFDEELIWLGIGIALLLVNLLLMSAVRRARIRKLIARPDDYALSEPLMTITVYNNGLSQDHTLTKRTIFVGRGSGNDINLGSDSNISRNHGVIMWRKGAWYYSNRKPRLTALINERKKRGLIFYKLKPFTEILIGNSLLVFHANAQEDAADFVKTNI